MTNFLDSSLGLKKEATYGTGVVVDRFLEVSAAPFKLRKTIVQGEGLRVGSRVARSNRRVVPFSDVQGEVDIEILTKGLGTTLELCMGTGASNLVSGGVYQQVFTFADTMPSATVQIGMWDGSAVAAYTYAGCQVENFSIEATENAIIKLKASFVGKSLATATGYATPSYTASASLFTFAHAAFYAGGTLTAPTTTVTGSATGTVLATVKAFTLNVDNQLKDGPPVGGLSTVRQPGLRGITGSATVEYSGNTFRDAIIAETAMLMLATFTNGTDVFQVIVPEVKLDGDFPEMTNNERITQALTFQGLDNLTAAQPLWLVVRTADTAL